MARENKVLTGADEAITIDFVDAEEFNGACSVQYHTGGVGTLVVEASSGPTTINGSTDDWVQLDGITRIAGVAAFAANITAAGYFIVELVGVKKVRVRKSVAGGGDCFVSLIVNKC